MVSLGRLVKLKVLQFGLTVLMGSYVILRLFIRKTLCSVSELMVSLGKVRLAENARICLTVLTSAYVSLRRCT